MEKKIESNDTTFSLNLSSSKKYLEERQEKNKQVKYMYHWLNTCDSFKDFVVSYDKIESLYKKNEINHDDYVALNFIICEKVTTGDIKKPVVTIDKDENLISCFHKRLWYQSDMSNAIQFRNCVTDMYMLGYVTLEEYIELNNDIDRYIQYTITGGN